MLEAQAQMVDVGKASTVGSDAPEDGVSYLLALPDSCFEPSPQTRATLALNYGADSQVAHLAYWSQTLT